MTLPAATQRWEQTLLRPIVLTVMLACVVWPLSQVIGLIAPGWNHSLLLGVCVLAALEAHASFRIVRGRYISGIALWQFRAIEAGFGLLLIKAGTLLAHGVAAISFSGEVVSLIAAFFDFETLTLFLFALFCALAITDALADFETLDDLPALKEAAHVRGAEYSPLDNLTTRFFVGGALAVAASGLARIGFTNLLNFNRPPETGLELNVLAYFVLGLLLLAHTRYIALAQGWQARGIKVAEELSARWMRYALAFVGLTALFAFALPTNYTSGALGWVNAALNFLVWLLWVLLVVLMSLFAVPLSWLMTWLAQRFPTAPSVLQPPPLFQMPTLEATPAQLPGGYDTARSLLVWGIVAAMALYIIVAYARARPEMLGALKRARWLSALQRWWWALRQRMSAAVSAARTASPLARWRDWRRRRAGPPTARLFRLGAASPREQILFYYLSLLRRAAEHGFPRRPSQTPLEYEPTLAEHLPAAHAAADELTQAFVEARYAAPEATPARASRARAVWHQVRAALQKQKRERPL